MKKSVLLLASLFLLSCSNDSTPEPQARCECGIITNIVKGGTVNNNTMYTLTIKNDCTGDIKTIEILNLTETRIGSTICR